MDVVQVHRSGAQGPGPAGSDGSGWRVPALAGATAFWVANLAISLTGVAAEYRSALSIAYTPMLVEAAGGGLVIGGAVAFLLHRFPDRLPGHGPLGKAVVLAVGALVLVTLLVGVPSLLRSDVDDPALWLLVGTVINAVRILALGIAIGLVDRARTARRDRPAPGATRKDTS